MAKTIKFNLICDDKPVRTIEDLQENFSIEDILKYYENGLLLRWLEVRGYNEEYKKVSDITCKEALNVVKELIKIFDIEADEKKVEEGVYMLQYLIEKKELYSIYDEENYKIKKIISDYQTGYQQLVDEIFDNPNNVAKIKSCIAQIVKDYLWIFELHHRELFWDLEEESRLAIMCLLMNEQTRDYFIPYWVEDDDGFEYLDTDKNNDKNEMYNRICDIITLGSFKSDLGNNLITFAGATDDYWKDLEPKGKKYMIISMGNGDFVRPAGVLGGDLSTDEVTNNFLIVDGIDYKSNSNTRKLLYMEV